MATVIACQRIKLPVKERSFRFSYESKITGTNCLSIHAQIDKSYLKNGNFAEVHFRVPDDISQMPRHSCYPIGACVATSFGIGVLAGWRVSDDIHIIRSLWKNRGHGSSCAYLRRDKIHGIVEAGIGFTVQTKLGRGKVLSYVQGGERQLDGNFFVLIKESGRFQGHVIELKRSEIQSCPSAKFVPVLEQIRAAAQFQIQMDTYKAALKEWDIETKEALKWSEEIEILFASFIKAIAEDPHFESELGHLTDALISFLEDLDVGNRNKSIIKEKKRAQQANGSTQTIDNNLESETTNSPPSKNQKTQKNPLRAEPGLLFINDLMGGIFKVNGDLSTKATSKGASQKTNVSELEERDTYDYDRAYAIIRMIKRALAIAQADVGSTRSDLRLALSIVSEFVVFFQAIIKVRQINVSKEAADIRFRTLTQVRETLYPIQKRIAKVGESIMSRLENHGKKAKARLAYLFDILVKDEKLLSALENGKWETCISRIERNVIKTKIVDASTCAQYHDKLLLIYNSLAPRARQSEAAALRSGEKIALFARIMKWMTEPRKVLLKFITRDDVLEVLERILVRVLHGDSHLSQVINIYAFNVRSFRYFRMLINMELSGKLWIPFLDAADDEISWAVTRMPDNTREFVVPLAKLFSLGVSSFRELKNAELATNWMNFLTEEPARSLIHELDMKLVLFVEAFCNDIKQTMTILPYYAGLDDDILNLLDEVDLDELLNEMSVAILDKEKFSKFLIEKSREAVNRFLHYLPKMSIPIERRDVSDGWVLTCRGKNGGDLTLSEVDIESKNLVCKVLGSSNVFSSKEHSDYSDSDDKVQSTQSEPGLDSDSSTIEVSILDHVKELLINAQHYGSWEHGRGGVDHSISLTGTPLEGIPMSQVLSCAVELWQNLEIDDDELMEIVIRDISYQIQCQKESDNDADSKQINSQDRSGHRGNRRESLEESPIIQNRFNPRIDPTLLDLDLCGMTFHLDEFLFRVEPKIRYSIFDPVFEGYGSLLIKNTSIKLKVECRKERIMKLGSEVTVPILQLQQLDISLDKVKFKFKETGADWLLNKAVGGFTTNITEIVESNMKQQIIAQIHLALEHLNAFVEVNPDVMLKVLGITMDELEENIVWV